MARLLAMCLNCESHPGPSPEPSPDPCGECESCRGIVNGSSPDVIELDAASNRGIDEIRALQELQENVHLAPMAGRRKVYIIDEAHQMTKDAYNAFLKTLEEPPAHVIFVLATTEPEKIIPTVRSRCQRFEFRPIPGPDLVARLKSVAQAESIEASDEFFALVARKAEGSVRDALGLLEQCVAFAGDSPTVEDFLTVTGGVDLDSLRRLSALVRSGRAADALALLDEMLRAGREAGAICGGLIDYLRDVFLTSLGAAGGETGGESGGRAGGSAGQDSANEGATPPYAVLLAEDAAAWSKEQLLTFIDKLVRADAQMRYSPQPRLILEMTLLNLSLKPERLETGPAERPAPSGAPDAARAGAESPPAAPAAGRASGPAAKAQSAPRAGSATGVAGVKAGQPAGDASKAVAKTAGRLPGPSATPEAAAAGSPVSGGAGETSRTELTLEWFSRNWGDALEAVRKRSVFVRAFLLQATPSSFEDGVLTLDFSAKFHKEQLEDPKNRQLVEKALSGFAGGSIRIRCRLQEGRGRDGSTGPAGAPAARPREKAPGAVDTQPPSGAERQAGSAGSSSPRGEAGKETGDGKPVPDTVRSALHIFGGRVVDDEPQG